MSGRKTEMCPIFDVYDKCVRKGVEKDDVQRKERSSNKIQFVVATRTVGSISHKHQSQSRDLVIAHLQVCPNPTYYDGVTPLHA